MPLFNDRENLAESTYVKPNVYSKNPWLKYLGYKNNGEMNTWGKVASWAVPELSLVAGHIASNSTQGTDAHDLIGAQQKNTWKKLGVQALAAATIATGGLAGAGAAGAATGAETAAGTAGLTGAAETAGVAGKLGAGKDLVQSIINPVTDAAIEDVNTGDATEDYYNVLKTKRTYKIGKGI